MSPKLAYMPYWAVWRSMMRGLLSSPMCRYLCMGCGAEAALMTRHLSAATAQMGSKPGAVLEHWEAAPFYAEAKDVS